MAITELQLPSPHDENAVLQWLGVSRTSTLRQSGLSRRDVEHLLVSGTLIKARNGWYTSDSTPKHIALAVNLGGQLTGVAGLNQWNCWTLPFQYLRIAVNHHARDHVPQQVKLVVSRSSKVSPPLQNPIDCAVQALFEPFEHALVALDSALHRRIVSHYKLEAALAHSRRSLALWDALDGRAESGLESLVRYRLQRRGVHVEPQVYIEDVGRVDMVVGDRVVIECDGAEFHENETNRSADYRRDRRLLSLGFLPIRFSYSDVVHNWYQVEPELLALIHRRKHRHRSTRHLLMASNGSFATRHDHLIH